LEYTKLGKTNLQVSRLGFGGAALALADYLSTYNPSAPAVKKEIYRAVETALQAGINYFDTAAAYGNGLSERYLGDVLSDWPEPIVVASKWGFFSEESLRESLENSLTRLKREKISIVQIHGTSFTDNEILTILKPGGIADELCKLREEGLLDYLGFTSEDNNPALYRLIQSKRFDLAQVCYNVMYQHPYHPNRPFGSLFELEKRKMGIVAMRVPTSGLFQKWIQSVNPHNTFDYTPALINFVLSNPLIDVALIGMRTALEVEKNVAIVNNSDNRMDLGDFFSYYVNPGE